MKPTFLRLLVLFFIFGGVLSCQTTEKTAQPEQPADPVAPEEPASPIATILDTSQVFSSNITGFALYDPEADSLMYGQHEDRYFTPASNTKLFTFYAGLKVLPEHLRGLDYVVRGDSLIFWGTGDPSFLHPDLATEEIYHFLQGRSENLYYSDAHFEDDLQGPGWSWSDYQYYYSPEKSPLPIYGNVARFIIEEIEVSQVASYEDGSAKVTPRYFQSQLEQAEKRQERDPLLHREMAGNTITYKPRTDTATYSVDKPFHYTPELIVELLADTLHKPVEYIDMPRPDSPQSLYTISADSLFKRMLHPSDNLVAEQLLLNAALELDLAMNAGAVIDYMLEHHLSDLADEPQWADGSGLSRYNMFTPRSIIQLLQKISEEFSSDKELFALLPAGGERGTIRGWYGSRDGDTPYVFAKTGTLSNNHTLSGFLITRSGKKLLFSIMNNHYITSSSVVKEEMEKLLWYIHEHY